MPALGTDEQQKVPSVPAAASAKITLRRNILGLSIGPAGEIFLADVQGDTPAVHVLDRHQFVEAIRLKQIQARFWHLVIPRQECLLKTLSLPVSNETEVEEMLSFEVPGLLPALDGNVCYGYTLLDQASPGLRRVAVVLAPERSIEAIAEPLRSAQILPEKVIPSHAALLAWAQAMGAAAKDDSYGLYIFVDRTDGAILVVQGNYIVSARDLRVDSEQLLDAGVLLAQAQRAIQPFGDQQRDSALKHIWLAGDSSIVQPLATQLEGLYSTTGAGRPVITVLDASIRMIEHSPATVTLQPSLGAMTALGVGLAARDDVFQTMNLTPASWREKRQRRRQWRERGVTAAFVLCAVLSFYLCLFVHNVQLHRQRAALSKAIEPIREVASQLELKKRQAQIIQSQLKDRSLPLEILQTLYRLVPKELALSHLTADLDGSAPELTLRGPATSLDAAFAFPSILESSSLFYDVRPEGAQQITRGSGTLIEYGCRSRIDPMRKGTVKH